MANTPTPDFRKIAEEMNTATPVSITQAWWRKLFARVFDWFADQLWKIPALLGNGTPEDARRLLGLENVTIAYTDRGDWRPDTDYNTNDLVWWEGSTYGAMVTHHSGNDFRTDLQAGLWRAVGGDLGERFDEQLKFRIEYVANSATELRALSGKVYTRAHLAGYYAPGDGGGGGNFIVGTPGAAADDGGTVFAGPDGPWIIEHTGDMRFANFGALGVLGNDGKPVRDETAQVRAACDWAAKRGGTISAEPWQRFMTSSTIHMFLPGDFQMSGARIVAANGFQATPYNYRGDIAYPVVVVSGRPGANSPAAGTRVQHIAVQGPYGGDIMKPPNIPIDQYTVLDGILVCGDYAQISEVSLKILSEGFRDCLIVGGAHTYLVKFDAPSVGKAWRRGWRWTRTEDTGENFSIFGGVTYNCVNSAGNAIAHYEDGSTNLDCGIHNHSFDYCDRFGELRSGRWTLLGCHTENNNNLPQFDLYKTAQMPATRLVIVGGSFGSGNLGNRDPYIPVEVAGGRPYFIGLHGGVSLEFDALVSGYNGYNSTIAKPVEGSQLKCEVRGYGDTRSNQQPGLPVPYAGANLVYNGDFEYGYTTPAGLGDQPKGWKNNPASGNTINVIDNGGRTGAHCLEFMLTNAASGASCVQDIPVSAGDALYIGGWVNAIAMAGGYVTLQLLLYAADGTLISSSVATCGQVTGPTGGYTALGGQLIVPVGVSRLNLQCYVTATVGQIRFDDIFACKI
ncbi:hypothetical protein [Paraburkholderia sp. J11-2]|uniref:hypothetical protein n=1 Tax=Paraburkholderia sp. J11-2 TaxID=2805431 RepID=UPI002AB68905|nr:hypothetical protein [Paraburkholderia sp. J11-2]